MISSGSARKLSILSVIYESLFLSSGIALSYFPAKYTDEDKIIPSIINVMRYLTFPPAIKNMIKAIGIITIIVPKSGCEPMRNISPESISTNGKNPSENV